MLGSESRPRDVRLLEDCEVFYSRKICLLPRFLRRDHLAASVILRLSALYEHRLRRFTFYFGQVLAEVSSFKK